MAFIWGGVPLDSVPSAMIQMAIKADRSTLKEGKAGWHADTLDDDNPSHHYAGLFYAGYFLGYGNGRDINWLRDGPIDVKFASFSVKLTPINWADIKVGEIGAMHGAMLGQGYISPRDVSFAIRYAFVPKASIWDANAPYVNVRSSYGRTIR